MQAPRRAGGRAGEVVPETGTRSPELATGATRLLGRDRELVELAELLGLKRLVTLAGPPGVGKSRLASELTRRCADGDRNGACVVELAPVSEAALVPAAIATALSIAEASGEHLTRTLVARLRGRRMLLVLDNCEHLIGACADIAGLMLSECPKLSILATSREPLALAGESVWQVDPLLVPLAGERDLESIAGCPAVTLFVERARAQEAEFDLTTYVAAPVAEICRRLDGIPLAIELAAARVGSLTPAEISKRLDDRFRLLTRGGGSDLPRHQTLEATLDWSHDLLRPAERTLLRRLAVFRGGFCAEAAEAICAGGELDASRVPHVLAALVSKSLVFVAGRDDRSPPRHRLLETVRAYAAVRLEETDEPAWVRESHARYYLGLAERLEPELSGPRQRQSFAQLDAERQNLRSALDWSLSHGRRAWAMRLAGALVLFWRVRCHFSEGRDLLDAVVATRDGRLPALEAKALWGAGFLTLMTGDPARARPLLEESLSLYRSLGDRQGAARALLILGDCMHYIGSPPLPALLLDESAKLAREAGDAWCLAHALGKIGLDHRVRHELPAARSSLEECLAVAREAQDPQGLRFGLVGLGSLAIEQGDYDTAEPLLEEAIAVARDLGEAYSEAEALQRLGELALGRGDYDRARELVERALALVSDVGGPRGWAPLLLLARVARADSRPGRARRIIAQGLAENGTDAPCEVLHLMGALALEDGNLGEATGLLEAARHLAGGLGMKGTLALALHDLGRLARAAGAPERGVALHNEALKLQLEIGDAPAMAGSLEAVAGIAAAAGRHRPAARLLGAADALRKRGGYARAQPEAAGYEADLDLVRAALPQSDLDAIWAEGVALSLEQAVAEAARLRGPRTRPSSGWSSLTNAERAVAALVAEGLSNRMIAERLVIEVGTVKNHLVHTYSKLGLTGRGELAREVWQRRQHASH
jgi:predicted ATPase/DNA-binding CsgD family transcriptional regulator